MYAAFPGGLRFENKDTNGIGNFTAEMLNYGTKKMTREELATEIEGMAGGINGFSGRNSSGVQANFLSKFFDKGLILFADVVQNPSFPEDEMEKLRKDILAAIKKRKTICRATRSSSCTGNSTKTPLRHDGLRSAGGSERA